MRGRLSASLDPILKYASVLADKDDESTTANLIKIQQRSGGAAGGFIIFET